MRFEKRVIGGKPQLLKSRHGKEKGYSIEFKTRVAKASKKIPSHFLVLVWNVSLGGRVSSRFFHMKSQFGNCTYDVPNLSKDWPFTKKNYRKV